MNNLDHRTVLLVARCEYVAGVLTPREAIQVAMSAASYEIGSQEKATAVMQKWDEDHPSADSRRHPDGVDEAIREACEYVKLPKSAKLRDWQEGELVYP